MYSCNPAAYITQTPTTPLFKEKGEAHIEWGYYMAGIPQNRDLGVGIKAAYALTDYFLVAGSYYVTGRNIDSTGGSSSGFFSSGKRWGTDHNVASISAGWYNHGKNELNSNWRVEVLGGITYASLQNQREDGWIANSKSLIYSVKPAIGYVSKNLTVFAALKFNYLDFIDFETNIPSNPFIPGSAFFTENDGKLIVEPSIGIQLGFEKIKFGLHYAYGSFNRNLTIESRFDTPIVSNSMIALVMIIRPKFGSRNVD